MHSGPGGQIVDTAAPACLACGASDVKQGLVQTDSTVVCTFNIQTACQVLGRHTAEQADMALAAPVEAEEGAALRIQLVPVEARQCCVMAVPVVVAAPRRGVLIPCADQPRGSQTCI